MQYYPPVNGDVGNPNRPYVNYNLIGGIEGSQPDARAIEHPMREILAVIAAAGITPLEANLTQLLAAINVLIAAGAAPDASTTVKGKVELATDAEALGGTDTTRACTSSGLASAKSLSTNGYYKLPGGLILQWGTSAAIAGDTQTTVTFPITFPNACFNAEATTNAVGGGIDNFALVVSKSTSQVVLGRGYASVGSNTTDTLQWFAIGN